ncbi:hypothetical protein H4Q32_027926 [Labeo rohita]|uniref:Retropepsins domain-containing protein n=1 Tax=Labeo rohita TaxID=84645 RepID=A0ABQ8L8L4_LABRO|nr:hypothetical protein H4Q32_027926 [Labeo rohita]
MQRVLSMHYITIISSKLNSKPPADGHLTLSVEIVEEHPHQGACPAEGKECKACGKLNHYAKVCRSSTKTPTQHAKHNDHPHHKQRNKLQRVKQVATACTSRAQDDSSSSEDAYVFVLNSNTCQQQPQTQIEINGTKITALIDSGAAVNIISKAVFDKLTPKPQLRAATIKIFAYGSDSALPIIGVLQCNVQASHSITETKFYVLQNDGHTLLSYGTAQELGLINITSAVNYTNTIRTVADELVESYPELFKGTGKLKNFQVKLHINPDVQPVPFHIRQKVEAELQKLANDDIIEAVTGPTPWVSPIVTPPKPKDPDKVRICVDMRQANTAIQRERHLTPTIDDVVEILKANLTSPQTTQTTK